VSVDDRAGIGSPGNNRQGRGHRPKHGLGWHTQSDTAYLQPRAV